MLKGSAAAGSSWRLRAGAATWMLVTAPAIPASSVIAFACLVILALFVGGLARPARRR